MVINSEDFAKLINWAYKKGWEDSAFMLNELNKTAGINEADIVEKIKEAFKGKVVW